MLVALLLLGSGRLHASPAAGADTLSRSRLADSVALIFWDWVDLSDSTLYIAKGGEDSFSAMENYCSEFFSLLHIVSDNAASRAVNNLMDKGLQAGVYDYLMAVAQKYLYNIQSPYFNEGLLLYFLDHKIARTDIAEIEKSRDKYLASMIRRNAVGSKALDFEIQMLKHGGSVSAGRVDPNAIRVYAKSSLYGFLSGCTERQMLMVVLFTSDCRDCRDGISRLRYSSSLRNKIAEGELAVLAVCIEGRLQDVESLVDKDWALGSDGGAIVQQSLYSTRNTPSIYLLERSGEVILKDASVSQAIDFLLSH